MTDFLLLAFIFLVAGVAAVPVASRLGLGSVLGYLIAGIVISPILALFHVDVVAIQHFAEFGVVMMLFLVGLELQPKQLWEMRGQLMGLGGGQVALTTGAVMAIAMVFGLSWSVALAVGLVLALSSTAIVLQTLNEKGLMRSDGGQASFSVLLAQDIAVIPMLALLPLLALPELSDLAHGAVADHGGGEDHGPGLSLIEGLSGWQTALVNVVAIAAVIGVGSILSGPLFRFIAAANLRELFTATALMLVIGIALLMSLVGLSPALGTFLAGVVLANSAYRHELESDIEPFKGLLLGLFFMTVGAGINFVLLSDTLLLVLALTVGLIAVKVAVLFALGTLFRLKGADRWLFALGLAQAGEFGFVLLSFTVANNVIPPDLSDLLLLVVALSMLLTPALFIAFDRVIAPRFTASEERAADEMPKGSKVIIAGAGRIGGTIERVLSAAGYSATLIDYSSRRLQIMARFGFRHYFGDATRPDLLAAAGIAEAQLLVVAIDDREQISELVKYVCQTYPGLPIVARAIDRDHVYDLYYYGCRNIVRETYDSSLRMGWSALEELGLEREDAKAVADAFDRRDREAMIAIADVHQVGLAPSENPAYIAAVQELRSDWTTQLQAEVAEILAASEARRASGGDTS